MPLPQPLTDDAADLIAERFRLLAEPMRVKILDRLRTGESTVHEIAESLQATPQNVSKHLGVLADAGIVARRKDGNFTRYRVIDDGVYRLCEDVCGAMEQQLEALQAVLRRASS
jgi:DNA-binding transcriptional ArsR family regulator